jgi:N6-adenosine-specific RNA methylase IME4
MAWWQKKAKPGRLSTSEGGFQHQDHVKMNVHISGNAMVMQKQNDQKVVSCARVKTQRKKDKILIITKQCPPLPKPTLVKLTSKQLL